jgi:hypothetical protein
MFDNFTAIGSDTKVWYKRFTLFYNAKLEDHGNILAMTYV